MKVVKILGGLLLVSFSLNFFLLPHSIASAGVGAIGHLLEVQFAIHSMKTVWLINILMLLLSYWLLDRSVFSKVLIGSLLFPLFLMIVPITPLFSSYAGSLIFGSGLFSLGVFTLYTAGSSNGGVTIPPLILEKHFRIPAPTGLLLTNLLIIILNFSILDPLNGLSAATSILIMSYSMKFYQAIGNRLIFARTPAGIEK
ncbi:YitT family protein [Candidatus Enterococcus ferrettii]|uniref:Transporter n=1 Tax=Candidatus Enterococcus ferrettii TaxID=2815324 RepID=A0ABV0EPD5_9ENTE|nr:YitT family protein [Enterococcus sp. 665A]MBO1339726.1 YitT family protein [Enterococcus sp. 665A]